jgi:hypothetical protein
MTPDTPRAVQARRGYSVFYEGKALLSAIDPVAAGERLVAALPKYERTLYLCVSPLFGYGLSRLLDTMHPSSALLCVETEKPLADFTRDRLPPEITGHPRYALVTDPTGNCPAAALTTVWALWGHRVFRRVVRFNLSSAATFHHFRYDAVEETLRREITLEWENAATLMKLGRRYALNFLRNLRLLDTMPSVETFRFMPEGGETGEQYKQYKGGKLRQHALPPPLSRRAPFYYAQGDIAEAGHSPVTLPFPIVHVLGAGPSLDRFFAGYHGGGIVCVDTALPALYAHGLKADLAVALEAQHWNLRDFVGCRQTARALAMDMSALPVTAGCVDGPVYLFFTPWTPLNLFDRLRVSGLLPLEMPPLGNVGITAYTLARCLFSGGATIAAHGLDFAFTIDQYHCRDSPGHIDLLRKLDRFHSPFPAAALRPSTFASVSEQDEPVRQDPVMRRYRELFRAARRNPVPAGTPPPSRAGEETAAAFIQTIRSELTRVRNILTGREKASGEDLRALLTQNDFLFAHYPDYAGTRKPADTGDLSFLKRIRAEIDPFIKALSAG